MKLPTLLLLISLCSFSSSNLTAQNHKTNEDLTILSFSEIDSFVALHYQNNDLLRALDYMQASRIKAKKEFGSIDTIYATSTAWCAFLYNQIGRYKEAEPLYVEAIDVYKQLDREEDPEYVSTIYNLAYLYQDMIRYEDAEINYLRVKTIQKKIFGEEHPDYLMTLNSLGSLYHSMGKHEKSELLLSKVLRKYEQILGKEHPEYLTTTNNLAELYQDIGRYEQAEPLYIECLHLRKKVFGKMHPAYASSVNNLAAFHLITKNYKKAEVLYVEVLDIIEQLWGKENNYYVATLGSFAELYRRTKHYIKAEPLYLEAIDITKRIQGEEHFSVAIHLNNLATLYKNTKRYEMAKSLVLQALSIMEKTLGKEHFSYSRTLNHLIELYYKMGEFKKAWTYSHQALNYSSGLNLSSNITKEWADSLLQNNYSSNEHINYSVIALRSMYNVLTYFNPDRNKQVIISDLAIGLLKKVKDGFSDSKDKLRTLSQSNDWMLRSLKVLDKDKQVSKAFNIAEQNKSILLLEATKTDLACQIGNLPDSLFLQEKNLQKEHAKIKASLIKKRPKHEKDSIRNLLIDVNRKINTFKKKINLHYPEYLKLKYQKVDINIEDIQKLLNKNTAILEYVLGDSVVYVFYIDQQNIQLVEFFVESTTLTKKIQQLHKTLSDYTFLSKEPTKSYQKYTEAAHWFYKNLVAPSLKKATNIEELIIVTDGELGHLPFEAFLVKNAPQSNTDYSKLHYLVTDYKISYNYSATLWKENKESINTNNNSQILAIAANYDIKLDSSLTNLRLPSYKYLRKILKPLPAARKEVNVLAKEFKGLFVFDSLATEKKFKEQAQNYTVIHLAMHGLLNKKFPTLSSLAFTENKDSFENNFLEAYEISKMKLNANLVVLSACETGYGKFEKGNGIASLARAFMYAGVPSLVVSLWQVNDASTAAIMKYFYKNLANKMDKAAALRQAKLNYINNVNGIMAHPAFWSPFIQLGNSSPINLATKKSWLPWAIVAGIIALILSIGAVLKIKHQQEL